MPSGERERERERRGLKKNRGKKGKENLIVVIENCKEVVGVITEGRISEDGTVAEQSVSIDYFVRLTALSSKHATCV